MGRQPQRVQHQLAMAEAHALGGSGRTSGIEHRRLGVFVEIREFKTGAGAGKQGFVLVAERNGGIERCPFVINQDEMPYVCQTRRDLFDQREKLTVEQEHVGLGVNQGEGDLFGTQAHIHRLQDRPHHRHGKKTFQITVAVPVHHRHSCPGFHAKSAQTACQAADPLAQRAVSKAQAALIGDFLLRRKSQRRMQQMLDEQGIGIGRGGRLNDFDGHDEGDKSWKMSLMLLAVFSLQCPEIQ